MHRVTATVRITLGLVALSLSILFLAGTFGLIPDDQVLQLRARLHFCETIALSSSALMSQRATVLLESHLETVLRRNSDLKRVVIRQLGGEVVMDVRPADAMDGAAALESAHAPISFPVFRGNEVWGAIDFHYSEPPSSIITNWLRRPFVRLSMFSGVATCVAFYWFL